MDRVAVFVDAGYVFAAGAVLVSGENRPRGDIDMDFDAFLSEVEGFAARVSALPLLRVYWYDGTSSGPSPQHLTLAFKSHVKLRLGFVNAFGQQKGVDSLLVTDMITLARNRAMADAVLVSGDEDIRVGVQQAQEYGVKVHLLGIKPSRGNQSNFLLQESDSTHEWSEQEVGRFLRHQPRNLAPVAESSSQGISHKPSTQTGVQPQPLVSVEQVAKLASSEVDPAHIEAVLQNYDGSKQLPPELDRPLLGKARVHLGILNPDQKRLLREAFISELRSRVKSSPQS